jgi:hypothetical protein
VVDVEVDDRHALGTVGLRRASGDGDIVEQAEAHRPVGWRMVTGRTHEGERASFGRGDRRARRQQRGLVARLGGGRVAVEPRRPHDPANPLEVLARVAAENRFLTCGSAFAPRERLEQD